MLAVRQFNEPSVFLVFCAKENLGNVLTIIYVADSTYTRLIAQATANVLTTATSTLKDLLARLVAPRPVA